MECTICFNIIIDEKKLECRHSFCIECIDKWFQQHDTCPLCRQEHEPARKRRRIDSNIIVDYPDSDDLDDLLNDDIDPNFIELTNERETNWQQLNTPSDFMTMAIALNFLLVSDGSAVLRYSQ